MIAVFPGEAEVHSLLTLMSYTHVGPRSLRAEGSVRVRQSWVHRKGAQRTSGALRSHLLRRSAVECVGVRGCLPSLHGFNNVPVRPHLLLFLK